LKRKARKRFSVVLWLFILSFLAVVITFPKWIVLFYPQPHRDIVFSSAYEYGVDPYLVFAIIRAESKFESSAESPVGAKGLMQIMPDTARRIASQHGWEDFDTAQLHQPEVNIRLGCWYLAKLNQKFENKLPLVIAAYNAGEGTVGKWLESGKWDGNTKTSDDIPFPETRSYVKNVMQNYEAYLAIYARHYQKE
jgi:soluble lytic murein transglycosylase